MFLTQGSNPCLLHCRWTLPSEPQGKSKNTGMGSLSLLQGNFPTQESNQGLLHCTCILYQLSYQGSPLVEIMIKYKPVCGILLPLFYIYIYIYIGCAKQHVQSYFPDQGLNLCPLYWRHRVLTTGPLGSPCGTLLNQPNPNPHFLLTASFYSVPLPTDLAAATTSSAYFCLRVLQVLFFSACFSQVLTGFTP